MARPLPPSGFISYITSTEALPSCRAEAAFPPQDFPWDPPAALIPPFSMALSLPGVFSDTLTLAGECCEGGLCLILAVSLAPHKHSLAIPWRGAKEGPVQGRWREEGPTDRPG
jgi:hypothetical protein